MAWTMKIRCKECNKPATHAISSGKAIEYAEKEGFVCVNGKWVCQSCFRKGKP